VIHLAVDDETFGSLSPESLLRVRRIHPLTAFDEALDASDLALVAGGLTLYHALSMGIPSIVLNQYAHQNRAASRMDRAKICKNLGMGARIVEHKITQAVKALARDRQGRRLMSRRAQTEVDRDGIDRVSHLIQVMKFLDWDTDFFGMRIAQLTPERINQRVLDYAFRYCDRFNIQCVYYTSREADQDSRRLAESNGFFPVMHRAEYIREIDKDTKVEFSKPKLNTPSLKLRPASKKDMKPAIRLSRELSSISRFTNDPFFPETQRLKLYEVWVIDCLKRDDSHLIVAEIKKQVVGFVLCRQSQLRHGAIDLIAVTSRYQKQGIGSQLLLSALQWFSTMGIMRVTVRTQSTNEASQRLFEKHRFTILRKDVIFHYHHKTAALCAHTTPAKVLQEIS